MRRSTGLQWKRFLAVVVVVLVASPHAAYGQCVCDINPLKSAMQALRTSISATGWSSTSVCDWSGVSCYYSFSRLTLCTSSANCALGSALPTNATMWNAIGTALSELSIVGSYFTGAFPIAAASALTVLSTLTFTAFSPSGALSLPIGRSYTLVLDRSNITAFNASRVATATVTQIVVEGGAVPDISGIASLATLTARSPTQMQSLTGVAARLGTIQVFSFSAATLPSWTGMSLPQLHTLVLSSVGVTTFPTSWSSLTSLESLSIASAYNYASTLPDTWSSMSILYTLTITGTRFRGPLPTSWGGGSLGRLSTINIQGAALQGASLPSQWTTLTSLNSLTIISSGLGGTLPQWATTSSLQQMDLSSNSIIGPLPTTTVGWGSLTDLDLSNNPIRSSVPLWASATRLKTIKCVSCSLTGPLPQWGSPAAAMTSLSLVSLPLNQFSAAIPASWGNMTSLTQLDMRSSSLTGQLPLSWTSLALNYFDVSLNSLSGNITGLNFATVATMSLLDLHQNRIGPGCVFTVPPGLQSLLLNDNLCSGSAPSWASATPLTVIDLSGNSFTGTLSSATTSSLIALRLDRGNRFTGALPNWASSAVISEVAANNNAFSGPMPNFHTAATPRLLQFANNNLSGACPDFDCRSVQYFDVSDNNFVGTLPPRFATASNLRELNIGKNSFTGTIPMPTGGVALLEVFDVACNNLVGTLPSLGASTNLRHVNVSCGNQFSGTVPVLSTSTYATLLTVDLSDQSLSGTIASIIPSSFTTNANSVVVNNICVGGNSLSGTLPPLLLWRSLQWFNASGNSLSGSFSTNGGTFPASLRSIDVSNNNLLRGTIPVPTDVTAFPQLEHYLLGGDMHAFSGALPALNVKFPRLTRISLTGTFSSAPFPYAWFVGNDAWVNLTTVSLRKCAFTGTFPLAPLASKTLTLLDLSMNQLSGALPADLAGSIPVLITLDLCDNMLSGVLPSPLPTTLQSIRLCRNNFHSGTADPTLWAPLSTSLKVLDLSYNNFSTPPLFEGTTSRLQTLNVSANNFNNTLPASWANCSLLTTLSASGSNFLGGVPSSWLDKGSLLGLVLRDLDLSSNALPDLLNQIPNIVSGAQLPALRNLKLRGVTSNESLSGSTAIGPHLLSVDLSMNLLVGPLPEYLVVNASNLTSLDLQGNAFVALPKGWGLQGRIPAALRILNMSLNRLTGPLPYTWGDLLRRSATLTIDLCGNSICGPVPKLLVGIANVGFARCGGVPLVVVDCYTATSTFSDISTVSSTASTPPTATTSMTDGYSLSKSRTIGTSQSVELIPTPTTTRTITFIKTPTPSNSITWASVSTAITPSTSSSRPHTITRPTLTLTMRLPRTPSASVSSALTESPTLSLHLTVSSSKVQPSDSVSIFTTSTSTPSETTTTSRTPSLEIPITATKPSASDTISLSQFSNTSVITESVQLSNTTSHSPSWLSKTSVRTVSLSRSFWDCTAVNASDIFVGIGNVSSDAVNSNGTFASGAEIGRFALVSPTYGPAANPTLMPMGGNITRSVHMAALPIDRHQLMDSPTALILNITVDAPFAGYWSVSDVHLGGEHLKWQSIRSRSGGEHLVAVHPPDVGWVGVGGLPLYYLDRVVVLQLTMACGSTPFLAFTITVPAPGIVREFAEQVKSATRSTQIASVFAGGVAAGAALARALTVDDIVMCDANSAASGGVIDLDLRICASDSGDNDATFAVLISRSAIVSNVLLVAILATFLVMIAAMWACCQDERLATAAVAVALSSALMPVTMATVPSTMTSIALIVARFGTSACQTADVALVLVGVVVSVTPMLVLLAVWYRYTQCGDSPIWVCVPRVLTPQDEGILGSTKTILRRVIARQWKWHVATSPGTGTPAAAQVLLLEYRILWYPALDAVVLSAIALLSVGGGLDRENLALCRASACSVIVMLIVQVIAIWIIRPFTSLFSFVAAAANVALTCLSVTAQFIVIYSSSSSTLWLTNASAGFNVVTVVVTSARMCLDAYDSCVAVRRRVSLLRRKLPVSELRHIDKPRREPKDDTGRSAKESRDGASSVAWFDDDEFQEHIGDANDMAPPGVNADDILFWDEWGRALCGDGTEAPLERPPPDTRSRSRTVLLGLMDEDVDGSIMSELKRRLNLERKLETVS